MAVTKIHAIKSTLKKALNYIMNEKKTDGGLLISSFNVVPETAFLEYQVTQNTAELLNGKNAKSSILAHHLIQSFSPGETTPEQAHEIGKKLAEEVLKGKYEYIISTHIDKGHIHNHIIFNSVSNVTYKKFNSDLKAYWNIRKTSDKLCKEYGLSVVQGKKKRGMNYREWTERNSGTSWKARLEITIDKNIKLAKSYNDFIHLMEHDGYEFKNGKHIAFKAKDQERFTRAKTLGVDYTQERIELRIKEAQHTRSFIKVADNVYRGQVEQASKLKLDLSSLLMVNKYLEYKKNARMFAKAGNKAEAIRIAEQLSYLRNQNINNGADLNNRITQLSSLVSNSRAQLKDAEGILLRQQEIVRYIYTYRKYEDTFNRLQKTPFKKFFEQQNKAELLLFESAKNNLIRYGVKSGEIQRYIEIANRNKITVDELRKTYKQKNQELETLCSIRDEIKEHIHRRKPDNPNQKHRYINKPKL